MCVLFKMCHLGTGRYCPQLPPPGFIPNRPGKRKRQLPTEVGGGADKGGVKMDAGDARKSASLPRIDVAAA